MRIWLLSLANKWRSTMTLKFLRANEVCDRSGLKRSQIFYLEKNGKFPRRVKISERAAGWVETEIDRWIESRIIASRGNASR